MITPADSLQNRVPVQNRVPAAAPTLALAIRRAMSLRCAMCGRGDLFLGLLRMRKQCEVCGFVFERGPGYFLGSTYINYGLTAGITTIFYVSLHFGLSVPNAILMPALLMFCGIFPVVFFRYARSLWLSLDCCFDRVGAEENFGRTQRNHDVAKTDPETRT